MAVYKLGLSALSGVLFALAFPDYSIAWLAFVAFVPLLYAIVNAKSARQAFLFGWTSQTIAWLMMVPWVVRVMSHYGGLPYFTGVAIFVAMSLYLGLYGALFGLVVYALKLRERFLPWLLVPLAWAAIELARTYLLTGFPWNLLGAAIVDYTPLIQIDRFAGPYLLGFLVLLPAVTITWLLTQRPHPMLRMMVGSAVAIVMFVWWATGYVREKIATMDTRDQIYTAALLQPNISQEMRWNDANVIAIFQRMMSMTDVASRSGADVIIWPESTVPLSYAMTGFYRDAIESFSAQHKADIILGSVAEDPSQPDKLWNAAFLASGGKTIGHYDKIRLVPFGEYVPLRKMLFFAKKLVHAVGEFEFGTNDNPLIGKHAYGPAICYEVVYPQITRTQVLHGADVLVTITNDAWYDGTSAPRQHLNQARLRAIEDDRWLLRAATTGISAWVDPTGRVVQEIPMGHEGILLARFAARKTVTPYVRYGDWFAYLSVVVVMIALVTRRGIEGRGSREEVRG
ncbi:MAG TPA: apolipoprotein N-acyltransferase [Thermoanaerobaculia bacterium]|nr:apolipoprotein N-acyltransferase [Thermoanaerobaculia bacterium]